MKSKLAAILAGPGLLAIAAGAHAQPAANTPEVEKELLGEIVVTARRQAETLQDVPQTVSVVTDKVLEEYVIIDFEDISQIVPGITLEGGTTGYQSNASVRGVRFQIESQASGPTTQFYVNEAPIEANSVFQAQYDIGQIEVLKGPQGATRGLSAPSGAFTLTTRPADPAGGWNGFIATTFDDHDGMNVQAALNVPIWEDKLALRVAGQMDESNANSIESINGIDDPLQDTDSYRASLTFTPADWFRARLMYQWLERRQETYGQYYVGPGATPANPNQQPLTQDQLRSLRDNPSTNDQRSEVATVNLDFSFAGQVLSYIGGWNDFELEDDSEGDPNNFIVGPALPLDNHATTEWTSHELRLSNEERLFNGLLDYSVGAFYQSIQGLTNNPSTSGYWPGSFGALGAVTGTTFIDDYQRITRVLSERDNSEESYYAGVDLHLLKGLEVSLGVRHIISKRDQVLTARQEGKGPNGLQLVNRGVVANCSGPITGLQVGGAAGFTLGNGTLQPSTFYPGTCDAAFATPFPLNLSPPIKDTTEDDVWNVAVSYEFTDNLMTYATAGTSFRNGPAFVVGGPGTNCLSTAYCQQYVTLNPETSIGYEVGFKSYLFERRGYFELALFQQTFDGFIVRGVGAPYRRGTTPLVSTGVFTYNADVVVEGFDALFNFDITDNWDAGLSVSYSDGQYDDALVPCRDSNFDGIPDANPLPGATPANPLGTGPAWDAAGGPPGPAVCANSDSATRAPPWNASLRSEFDFPAFTGTTAFIRGLYTYYAENDNAQEDQNFVVDAYGVLNLYIGLRSDSGTWDVQVFARNVLEDDTLRGFSDDFVSTGFSNPTNQQPYFPQTVQYNSFSIVPEREIGVTLRYNFGR